MIRLKGGGGMRKPTPRDRRRNILNTSATTAEISAMGVGYKQYNCRRNVDKE